MRRSRELQAWINSEILPGQAQVIVLYRHPSGKPAAFGSVIVSGLDVQVSAAGLRAILAAAGEEAFLAALRKIEHWKQEVVSARIREGMRTTDEGD